MSSIVFEFELIVLVWTGLAVPALVSGLMGHDPFGRWGGQGYGPRIGPQLGWFLMELPALLVLPLAYLAVGERHLVTDFLVGVWVAHYAHRTLVWPWIVQQNSDGIPAVTCAAGFGFNVVNGLLLWWSLTALAGYTTGWFGDIRFIAGAVIMLLGAVLNIWSDYRLAYLRSAKPGQRVLPVGGPFRFVFVSQPDRRNAGMGWLRADALVAAGAVLRNLDGSQSDAAGPLASPVVSGAVQRLPRNTPRHPTQAAAKGWGGGSCAQAAGPTRRAEASRSLKLQSLGA